MANQYLSVVYDEQSHPYSDYPGKLCAYLFEVFCLERGMKMLEPGCGRGEFLSHFQNLGLDVVGLDISEEAQNFGHNFDVKICNVENEDLPFDNDTFDLIYSKSFIEHLYYPEKYLKEAYRVLKPGGLLLTLVPDWESNYKTYFDDFTHRTPFTKVALRDAYQMFGFKEIEVIKFRQLPILWRYPFLNYISMAIAPFVPVRTRTKFFRWSRELMLVGAGRK
ncbi:class I SAM-dependent methyltransferase [Alphaproteobacteria bacterium]|nr:class I SAM-dependent methyltransferase [Alphaproteobacteria bacterium]